VSCPDIYRGRFRDCDYPGQNVVQMYANEVKAITEKCKTEDKTVSMFIAESMQSCGGQIILPDGYLKSVYK